MYYIVSSHGNYAKSALKSCEMITGSQKDFYGYSFDGKKNIEGVEKDYEKIIENKKINYKDVTILTDLNSGTPNNAAIMLAAEHKISGIYTGISLSDLVFLAMGENIDNIFNSKLDNSRKVIIQTVTDDGKEED